MELDKAMTAERHRLTRHLERLPIKEGAAKAAAHEQAKAWEAESIKRGVDPTPSYVRKGQRWLAKHHRR